jgi:hypothetical protein
MGVFLQLRCFYPIYWYTCSWQAADAEYKDGIDMAKEPDHEVRKLVCSPNFIQDPEDLLTFIQMPAYTASYTLMGLTDDEQRAIETGIMVNPLANPVLDGTGGVRVFECSTPSNGVGSLHLSVFHAYFPETQKVALLEVLQSDSFGPLTNDERAELRVLFDEIQQFGPESWGS